jgi:tetratricopeptide (TPR) repeat protein
MLKSIAGLGLAALLAGTACAADEMEHHHDHPAPEKLGVVTFTTSCDPQTKTAFERAVALLHSFAYSLSRQAFAEIADSDPHCAMAFWGEAMTHYHELWEPNVDSEDELREGSEEVRRAAIVGGAASPRERQYIEAIGGYYLDWSHTTPAVRAQRYSSAMGEVARAYPSDDEAQIFYALSLLATASPSDRTHANQKHAAAILEPLWKREPQHPGIAHYLIHAYDSTELAQRGLAFARAYAKIAPSAPHALHMPSHIFTRLGLWEDSVASNIAARAAARAQGDLGEELHAMDYLTYAYLQLGRYDDAANVVAAVRAMPNLPVSQFKVGYAANAMRVRLAVETRDWESATQLSPLPGSTPKVAAIVYWARALGHTRAKLANASDADITALATCLGQLRAAGEAYWAAETDALLKSALAWEMQRHGDSASAIASLSAAADEEDALEKLPVTPGPIVPAREQLGELLLDQHRAAEALREFKAALALAPGRRASQMGAIAAAEEAGDTQAANQLRAQLAGPTPAHEAHD